MEKLKVGVLGCGAIASIYIHNMKYHYDKVEVISCADLLPEKAEFIRKKYDLKRAYTNEELLADPEVDIILNLTVPSVHYELNKAILNAGKHLYCEKPLAVTVEQANEIVALGHKLGLRVSDAPDTFLGPGIQTVRKLLDDGVIGDVTGFTANLFTHGHELWHPSPMFYYEEGGGPMRDMGPYYLTALISLLGPVEDVACFASKTFRKRDIKGTIIDSDVYTQYNSLLRMRSGVYGNVNMSWEVWNSKLNGLEIYGTDGMITVPDPNATTGPVFVYHGDKYVELISAIPRDEIVARIMFGRTPEAQSCYEEVPLAYRGGKNMRGIATVEMAMAIADGRPQRASGEMAAHIVDILDSMERSQETGKIVKLSTTFERPEAFYPVAEGVWLGDLGTESSFV